MKFYKVFFFSLLLSSCKEKVRSPVTDTVPVIELKEIFDHEDVDFNLSQIASGISYIRLESSDESILDKIEDPDKDIKFYKEKILVKDKRDNLMLFNDQGDFLTQVGRHGRGPGEYLSIDGFTFYGDSLIAINSRHEHKILLFDHKGRFSHSFKSDYQLNDLYSFGEYLIGINNNLFRNYSNFYANTLFNGKGVEVERLFKKEGEEALYKRLRNNDKEANIKWSPYTSAYKHYNIEGKQYYWEYSRYDGGDTVWKVSKDLKVTPAYVLEYGGRKPQMEIFYIDRKDISESDADRTIKTTSAIEGLIDTKDFFFLEIFKNRRLSRILGSKRDGRNQVINYEGFHNDLDGGLPFWPDGQIDDHKVFKLLEVTRIMTFLKENPNKLDDIEESTFKDNLLRLINEIELADNPILMVVDLKD